MTIKAENDPLLRAATRAAEHDDVESDVSAVLGRQYDRVRALFASDSLRVHIKLPELGYGRTDLDQAEVAQDEQEPSGVFEWAILSNPVCDVEDRDGTTWYLYPVRKVEVVLDDHGVDEWGSSVAIIMARESNATEIVVDTAVEVLHVSTICETECTKRYESPELQDYLYTDMEVAERYEGLLDAIEADIAARN